ncbi:MAG TPA: amidohydrolase family protein [Kofleriaceae bacterium]|nr:amidohydrolase family protein [Kofleriaceae bacterium]
MTGRWWVMLVSVVVIGCGSRERAPAVTSTPRVLAYSVVTMGRISGDGELTIEASGTRRAHFQFNDRGRGPDLTTVATFDERGALATLRVTGVAYHKQPVDERLELTGTQLRWQSTSERGTANAGGFYVPRNDVLAWWGPLVRALLRAPDRRLALVPGGEARIEDDQIVEVSGRRRHQLAIAGFGFTPTLMWVDDDGELFAVVSTWSSTIRRGSESLAPTLIEKDNAWLAARAAKLAKALAQRPPPAGLAITHARVFDAETKTIVPDATVVVVGDQITAVGKVPVPAGAQVIDARGRTLLPGLWDMHVHLLDGDGLLHIASGITTVRDMGNAIDELAARVARFDAGTEVGPRVIRAGIVDGPGKLAVPTGLLISTREEAKAAVDRYADTGYAQLKIYSSVTPDLVPMLAAQAHARGMRVSGHVPNGMRAMDAVNAGFDELQHGNFLMLQFLAKPGDDTRTPVRFRRVAEDGATLDLDGKDVTAFLDFLVAHKTVIDPTLVTFEALFNLDPGELDPGVAPYAGRLPVEVERASKEGGLDGDRAVFRRSYVKMVELVARAWKRGIPVVAGTDAPAGLYLSRELELYVHAGIPAPDVLAIATLGAARVMKRDRTTGSIAVGKAADLVLVDGDPTRDIGAVRNADVVVCRGIVYDPREVFAAAGMKPRPGP